AMGAQRQDRLATAVRVNGADNVPGHMLGLRRTMAQKARIGLPDETRCWGLVLFERVEDRAELGIGDAYLHDLAVLTIADVRFIVKVERPRRPRADAAALHASLGKDQYLRGFGDSQGVKDGGQVTEVLMIVEAEPALIEPLLQTYNGVV